MRVFDVVQGTDDWFNVRAGKPSASMFGKIIIEKPLLKDELIQKLKHLETEPNLKKLRVDDLREMAGENGVDIAPNLVPAQTDYVEQLVAETLGGYNVDDWLDDYDNVHTLHGKNSERKAIKLYEETTGQSCHAIGFVTDDAETYGCSPDMFVEEDGLLEIKSPMGKNLIKYWMEYKETGQCPKDFKLQVQGQLMITGRDWCDLILYHPHIDAKVIRVLPDYGLQAKLKEQIEHLLKRRDEIVSEMVGF